MTTPSRYACHPSKEGNCNVKYNNHDTVIYVIRPNYCIFPLFRCIIVATQEL